MDDVQAMHSVTFFSERINECIESIILSRLSSFHRDGGLGKGKVAASTAKFRKAAQQNSKVMRLFLLIRRTTYGKRRPDFH